MVVDAQYKDEIYLMGECEFGSDYDDKENSFQVHEGVISMQNLSNTLSKELTRFSPASEGCRVIIFFI